VSQGLELEADVASGQAAMREEHVWWLYHPSTQLVIPASLDPAVGQLQELPLTRCVEVWGWDHPAVGPAEKARAPALCGVSTDPAESGDANVASWTSVKGRRVAVPRVPVRFARLVRARRTIFREIAALATLGRHPHVVHLHAVLERLEPGRTSLYLLLDLATGGELFDRIAIDEGCSEPAARYYFRQLLRGVSFCHAKGVVHRDLKPENLLLAEETAMSESGSGGEEGEEEEEGDGGGTGEREQGGGGGGGQPLGRGRSGGDVSSSGSDEDEDEDGRWGRGQALHPWGQRPGRRAEGRRDDARERHADVGAQQRRRRRTRRRRGSGTDGGALGRVRAAHRVASWLSAGAPGGHGPLPSRGGEQVAPAPPGDEEGPSWRPVTPPCLPEWIRGGGPSDAEGEDGEDGPSPQPGPGTGLGGPLLLAADVAASVAARAAGTDGGARASGRSADRDDAWREEAGVLKIADFGLSALHAAAADPGAADAGPGPSRGVVVFPGPDDDPAPGSASASRPSTPERLGRALQPVPLHTPPSRAAVDTVPANSPSPGTGCTPLARLASVVGSPFYTAPEVTGHGGAGYDGLKADAWSCGVILFAMLTGGMPFGDDLGACPRYRAYRAWVTARKEAVAAARCAEQGRGPSPGAAAAGTTALPGAAGPATPPPPPSRAAGASSSASSPGEAAQSSVPPIPAWIFPARVSARARRLVLGLLDPDPVTRTAVPDALRAAWLRRPRRQRAGQAGTTGRDAVGGSSVPGGRGADAAHRPHGSAVVVSCAGTSLAPMPGSQGSRESGPRKGGEHRPPAGAAPLPNDAGGRGPAFPPQRGRPAAPMADVGSGTAPPLRSVGPRAPSPRLPPAAQGKPPAARAPSAAGLPAARPAAADGAKREDADNGDDPDRWDGGPPELDLGASASDPPDDPARHPPSPDHLGPPSGDLVASRSCPADGDASPGRSSSQGVLGRGRSAGLRHCPRLPSSLAGAASATEGTTSPATSEGPALPSCASSASGEAPGHQDDDPWTAKNETNAADGTPAARGGSGGSGGSTIMPASGLSPAMRGLTGPSNRARPAASGHASALPATPSRLRHADGPDTLAPAPTDLPAFDGAGGLLSTRFVTTTPVGVVIARVGNTLQKVIRGTMEQAAAAAADDEDGGGGGGLTDYRPAAAAAAVDEVILTTDWQHGACVVYGRTATSPKRAARAVELARVQVFSGDGVLPPGPDGRSAGLVVEIRRGAAMTMLQFKAAVAQATKALRCVMDVQDC